MRFALAVLAITAAGLAAGVLLVWATQFLDDNTARVLMLDALPYIALGIVIGFGWAEWLDRGLHR